MEGDVAVVDAWFLVSNPVIAFIKSRSSLLLTQSSSRSPIMVNRKQHKSIIPKQLVSQGKCGITHFHASYPALISVPLTEKVAIGGRYDNQ
jgi:hypothetical protein